MTLVPEAVVLFRPVGDKELALIRDSGCREFPPRLPEQPIFYPVVHEAYAVQIARDAYRFPLPRAARIALEATSGALADYPELESLILVAFDRVTESAFIKATAARRSTPRT